MLNGFLHIPSASFEKHPASDDQRAENNTNTRTPPIQDEDSAPLALRLPSGGGKPQFNTISPDAPLLQDINPYPYLTEQYLQYGFPRVYDSDVTVVAGANGLGGAVLTVRGLLPKDSMSIVGVGDNPGEVNFDGATGVITYGGAYLASLSGGQAGADLVITFDAGADAAGVEAVIEALGFINTSPGPTPGRVLNIQLADANGLVQGAPRTFTVNTDDGVNLALSGAHLTVAFGDLDGDGDADMVVGNATGAVSYHLNYGTARAGRYSLQPDGLFGQPTSGGVDLRVALGDLDGDGDLDLVTGNAAGDLKAYYNQRSGAAGPLWQAAAIDPFGGALAGAGEGVGGLAIADVDSDGLADVLVGRADSALVYFHNTGAVGAPVLTPVTGPGNPFYQVSGQFAVSPAFIDLDKDGDLDLFLGGENLSSYWENTGSATAPQYQLGADPIVGAFGGDTTRPTFVDLNGDGDLDLVAGVNIVDGLYVFLQQDAGVDFTLQILTSNARPTLSGLTGQTFAENTVNATPQLLLPTAVYSDLDGGSASRVVISGLLAEDRVSMRNEGGGTGQIGYDAATRVITYEGVKIGVLAGGVGAAATLVFGAASQEAVQAALSNLTYANVSNTPTAARTLSLTLQDGDGAWIIVPGAPAVTEIADFSSSLIFLDWGANASPMAAPYDADGNNDVILRVGNTLKTFATDNAGFFYEFYDGVFDAFTIPNNAPFLAFDADADGDLDVVYRNGSNVLTGLEFTTFSGMQSATVGSMTGMTGLNIGATARNMVLADITANTGQEIIVGRTDGTFSVYGRNAGGTYVAMTGAANPLNGIDVGDNAAPTFFDVDGDGDQDMLVGRTVGTIAYYRNNAGTFASQTGANNPFNGIDVGDNSAPAFLDVDQDSLWDYVLVGNQAGFVRLWGNATAGGRSILVTVNAEAEPPVVNDDDFAILENGLINGDVAAANGHGADDVGLTITHINGQPLNPGAAITLPSGARLTMNANGTFTYDPNHRFDALGAPISGAVNTSATDSFTYTAAGVTASVTVAITGADSSNDVLNGDGAINEINGGDGNDIVNGLAGPDRLFGGVGGDILNGGDGDDILNGDDGGDKLNGGDGEDQLLGGLGNDRLDGGDGIDTLTAGAGNDYLDGGAGADLMTGGLANDVYIVDDAGDMTLELPDEGYDIVRTALSWTLADNIEALELQGSADAAGTGAAGSNNLQGNSGDNTLSGLAGVDTINGNDGDDIVIGGEGNDLLRGGTGADSFRVAHAFGPVLETDQIYDFSAAEGDIVDLSDAYAGILTLVGAFSKQAGQMTLGFAAGITSLKLDINGDGKADYQMKINGDVTGESGDWLL